MPAFTRALENLRASPQRWLVTGCAGFIGSHLVETLLANGQHVVGLDNFSSGSRVNVLEFSTTSIYRNNFQFIEGDIRDLSSCQMAMSGVDFVLHQAAL